ncbi:hypothetical protein HDU97_000721 [Phlyctochytrium planicorne]|nr:hypothetical protein HDU97_000721 [Phlyctochytrium planicorne]
MRSSTNKVASIQARPGANKPFMTEYKLAYRDPCLTKGGKGYGSIMGTIPRQRRTKGGNGNKVQPVKEIEVPKVPRVKDSEPPVPAAMPPAGVPSAGKKDEAFGFSGSGLGGVQLPFIENRNPTVRKHVSKRDIWNPPPPSSNFESTSLTLPGMMSTGPIPPVQTHFRRRRILGGSTKTGHSFTARYNIISGAEINGEPHSGYKEGRRAVIQSFAHIDSTTNARTPGYNIISNTDYREVVPQK